MSVAATQTTTGRRPRSLAWLRRSATAGLGLAALLLVGGAVVTRVLGASAEAKFPPLGSFVEIDGLRQHVLEQGSGPPVVFVHGAYGAMQDFAATILDDASADYRCVLWDRPGHGYSERPAAPAGPGVQASILIELVRRMELDRPLLVGFSYGGAVCLAAALEAPDEIRGVVLVNGPTHPWPGPLDIEYRLSEVPLVGWLLSETVIPPAGHLLADGLSAQAFAPLSVPPAFERSPLPLALRAASYRANTEDLVLLRPFLRALSERYPDLRVPVLALVSTRDTVVSPTLHVPQLVEASEQCALVPVEGAGHQLLYTHPELVLRAIDQGSAAHEPHR